MKVDKVIIHHSASPDSKIQNWGQIRRYHVEHNGWGDIGYHYGIEFVDYTYEVLMGRFENKNGAHCPGQNMSALGICLIGNFELNPIPERQWNVALKLVRQLMANHELSASDIYAHRDFKATACPGKHFDLAKFRSNL